MKFSFSVVLLIFLSMVLSGCDRAKLTGIELDKIDLSQDPLQTPYSREGEEPILRKVKNGSFTLTRVAQYKVNGCVISKEYYSYGWDSIISPVDLLIVWGNLADPGYRKPIIFSQDGRWYHYKWKEGARVDSAYIITHSSNNHILPANENIYRAVKQIKKEDPIVLEGFLVNVRGTFKNRPVSWNTSLTRTDTGNGSCELFYVSKVRIDTKVYE